MSNLNNRLSKLENQQHGQDDIAEQIQRILCNQLGIAMTDDEIEALASDIRQQGYNQLTWASVMQINQDEVYKENDFTWGRHGIRNFFLQVENRWFKIDFNEL